MPDNNRGGTAAFVVFGLFCILAAAMVGTGYGILLEKRTQAQIQSDLYAVGAANEVERSCLEREGAGVAECAAERERATYQFEHSKRDLDAQEAMAKWTLWIFAASMLTVGMTALGVYFVWGTLREAQAATSAAVTAAEAAIEANRLVQDERRPWLVIEREVNCDFVDLGHGGRIVWNYEFVNRGKMPAYDYKLSTKFIRRDHLMYMDEQLLRYAADRMKAHTLRGSAILFPDQSTNHRRYAGYHFSRYGEDGVFETGKHVLLMACLTYRLTHNGDKFGYDARIFEVEESREYLGPFGHTILEFGSARVVG